MKVSTCFRLERELLANARKLSDATGIPVTYMIESSLREYLKKNVGMIQATLFEEEKSQKI